MTNWKGSVLASPIVGGDDTLEIPTHYSVWGAGGYVEMPTIVLRDAIPSSTFLHDDGLGAGRRRNMMMVSVADSDGLGNPATYQLIISGFSSLTSNQKITALADNSNWAQININDLSDFVTLTGIQTLTNKTIINPIINCAVGSAEEDAVGDIYYRDDVGQFTRLGIGDNGQILTSNGILPGWSSVLGSYLPLAGGTMDGPINMDGNNVTSVSHITSDDLLISSFANITSSCVDFNVTAQTVFLQTANPFKFSDGARFATITTAGFSANRNYTLPDASGTFALISNLAAYVQLAGDTMTGDLYFPVGKGVVLKSPDNTNWKIVVDNDGIVSAVPI